MSIIQLKYEQVSICAGPLTTSFLAYDLIKSWQHLKQKSSAQLISECTSLSLYLNALAPKSATMTSSFQLKCLSDGEGLIRDSTYVIYIQILRMVEECLWIFLYFLENVVTSMSSDRPPISPSNKSAAEIDKLVEEIVTILESSAIRCMYTLPFVLHSKYAIIDP